MNVNFRICPECNGEMVENDSLCDSYKDCPLCQDEPLYIHKSTGTQSCEETELQ